MKCLGVCLFFWLFLGWCFPPSYGGPSFLAKNFLHHCKLIQQSSGFESHFNEDEKAAVRLSVRNIETKMYGFYGV